MRNDGGLNQGSARKGGKNYLASEYILKAEAAICW